VVVEPERAAQRESLAVLLGGRRGAVDATLPGVAFVVAWVIAERLAPRTGAVTVGCAAAVAVAVGVAIVRIRARGPLRAVLLGLLGVCVAAVVALYTGRAEDFFLVQVLSNAASALAWLLSIVVRWPLLGVVVGTVLGQRAHWRRDRALLRAYSLASWVWVGQYLLRLAVFTPLWMAGQVVGLGVARAALSWPLVACCLALSWWVLRRSLPAGHPGVRHPATK
jgi:hypothetical protein